MKEMGRIDWNAGAAGIIRRVRALVQWPTAYTFLEDRMVKVFKARPGARDLPPGCAPGSVLAVSAEGIEIAAGAGSVVLQEVQAENRKRMAASDFARGLRQISEKQFRVAPHNAAINGAQRPLHRQSLRSLPAHPRFARHVTGSAPPPQAKPAEPRRSPRFAGHVTGSARLRPARSAGASTRQLQSQKTSRKVTTVGRAKTT